MKGWLKRFLGICDGDLAQRVQIEESGERAAQRVTARQQELLREAVDNNARMTTILKQLIEMRERQP
jgi:hypothetical protein